MLFGKKITIDYQVVMFAKQYQSVRCCSIYSANLAKQHQPAAPTSFSGKIL
jgi:hypothetical protein